MFSLMLLLWSVSGLAQPRWFEGSFDDLQARARQSNKPYLVYFYTASLCSGCKSFETQTLQDAATLQMLNDRFLIMRLDAESLERQGFQLASQYRLSLYPSILLFQPDGTLSGTLLGFQSPSMLRTELEKLSPAPAPRPVATATPSSPASPAPKPAVVTAPKPAAAAPATTPGPSTTPRPAATPAPTATRARTGTPGGWWKVEASPVATQGYGVQVGVFSQYEAILQEISRLSPIYRYPMAVRAEQLRGQTVFKLVFGPFPDEARAREFKQRYDRAERATALVIWLGE